MVRDNNKCILCRRCVAVCEKVQEIGVIGANNRGFDTMIGSALRRGWADVACVSCGQCIAVCPTGALYEKDYTDKMLDAIAIRINMCCSDRSFRPRSTRRGIRHSRSARMWRARWLPRCAASASIRCSTPTSAPTSLSWRRRTSLSTA